MRFSFVFSRECVDGGGEAGRTVADLQYSQAPRARDEQWTARDHGSLPESCWVLPHPNERGDPKHRFHSMA
jgi:hypothetical protein